MVSSIQQEASMLYNRLLQSKALLSKIAHLEFVTQPKEEIYRENKLTLYRFQPKVKKIAVTPLLIVFALINRPDVLDFSTERSFIKGLLEEGRDVYLLDWGYPSQDDHQITLSVYLTTYLRNCVKKIKQLSGQSQLDLVGICQGGVLSICYAALFPNELRRLVLISTPIDFHTPQDILSKLIRSIPVGQFVERRGNIPGSWVAKLFISLKPFQLLGKKYLALLDHLSSAECNPAWLNHFFLIEKWLLDTPDLVGNAFSEFVKIFYQQNSFVHGKFNLAACRIDLRSLTMPILNVIARDDHIVPPEASRALRKVISSPAYSTKTLPAGHIGIYLSQKTNKRLSHLIASWLNEKEESVSRRRQWKSRKKQMKNQKKDSKKKG